MIISTLSHPSSWESVVKFRDDLVLSFAKWMIIAGLFVAMIYPPWMIF